MSIRPTLRAIAHRRTQARAALSKNPHDVTAFRELDASIDSLVGFKAKMISIKDPTKMKKLSASASAKAKKKRAAARALAASASSKRISAKAETGCMDRSRMISTRS